MLGRQKSIFNTHRLRSPWMDNKLSRYRLGMSRDLLNGLLGKPSADMRIDEWVRRRVIAQTQTTPCIVESERSSKYY